MHLNDITISNLRPSWTFKGERLSKFFTICHCNNIIEAWVLCIAKSLLLDDGSMLSLPDDCHVEMNELDVIVFSNTQMSISVE